MADNNTKTCPHDCTQCTPAQRLLCAAQFSRMNAETLGRIEAAIVRLTGNSGEVFNPTTTEEKQDV